ncbi:MAG TPA: ATPase domain-containing protein, partial [Alphaproteobacteria bacterium]|nr:ATPase domain-containing protein [Alphaproteobacteria bacterium]
MAKAARQFVCQECGGVSSKWAGKCEACGAWNAMAEEAVESSPWTGAKNPKTRGRAGTVAFSDLRDENAAPPPRCQTGIAELDRVTGGGFVPGSALLIGGDPGIGKSTLLLQAACALARKGLRCAYV